ncbi:GNAT family N-acetyltransferase [Amycolatopsis australiensis]|uniref:Acetyltransferase (GNAT) family protein n=1 Tax=Amycolatopsis australiensis TaxID=546364 RepID=A0A1K1REY6_9PSEU|nr:GNAT family N-acetyltransferase [Amycolatopsis australiensis]SFW70513.1 Acetyltransferase (GNAT) family protein [Amycolatopsis australiensis]
MHTSRFIAGDPAVVIARVAQRHWHALADDRVIGRGEASPRPDGRTFLSIDAWHRPVFDRLADAMLADLPSPLYTVVDEVDRELTAGWQRAGFTTRRREWDYVVPTGPRVAGLAVPPDVTIGPADEGPLRALDRVIRAEVEASVGWQEMPAEVRPRAAGDTIVDPALYTVAAEAGRYVGLIRVVQATRLPRIGLIAVRAGHRRRGIARALLAHALGALHESGIPAATAEVNEANPAATALFGGIGGARRMSSALELVFHGE